MMPDYGGDAIYRIAGQTPARGPSLLRDLEDELDAWVLEWEDFHDCRVSDDTHEEWARRGRELRPRIGAVPVTIERCQADAKATFPLRPQR